MDRVEEALPGSHGAPPALSLESPDVENVPCSWTRMCTVSLLVLLALYMLSPPTSNNAGLFFAQNTGAVTSGGRGVGLPPINLLRADEVVRVGDRKLSKAAWASLSASLACTFGPNGTWIPTEDREWIVPYAVGPDSACGRGYGSAIRRDEAPGLWFAWAPPARCPLAPWNRQSFCRLMAGRELLVVGDSLHYIFHDVILSALFDPRGDGSGKPPSPDMPPAAVPHTLDTYSGGHGECVSHVVCDSPGDRVVGLAPFRLQFVRNDYVSLHDDNFVDRTANNIENPWARFVRNSTVILLNRGAHYQPDDMYLATVRDTLRFLRGFAPGATVLFRTTPPGHVGADKITVPLAERQDMPGVDMPYNYAEFRRQNAAVAELLREEEALGSKGVLLLDVEHATALRGDQHRDPIHYCIPGPADWWLAFFHHTLLELEKISAPL